MLKHIEIQGFKSFPDKTKIVFDNPYTAIVGPNGSGKSNISDAVRWVLGEQSTKSLRGGKMEDVIFGGTQLRKAMGFAQVALCLDNESGRIPDAGSEVIVTRRFYRSGDSEYLVNGATVRLRDVREMFMDTGLGRDGYSIIGQGRIAEIVSAKSADRRDLFEEASGISKYRFRKTEADRKLEAAQDNLSRLRDILDELEGRIGPLTQQSAKAKQFLQLSDEKKSLEITLYCDNIERSRDNMRLQDDKINVAQQDYTNVAARLGELEEQMEQTADVGRRTNAEIDARNAEILRLNELMTGRESEIAVLNNDIRHGTDQIAMLLSEREALAAGGTGIAETVEQRRLEIAQRRSEIETVERLIADAEAELTALIESSEQSDKKRVETAKRLTDLQNEVTDLRVDNVAIRSTNDAVAARVQVIEEALPGFENRLRDAKKEFDENAAYLKTLLSDIAARDNQIKGYVLKSDDRKQKLAAESAALEKENFEIQNLINKAQMLRDMDKNLDGFSPGVRHALKAGENREIAGIIGTVASLIRIRGGNELAIETALGVAAQNIVVSDERAAKQCIRFLKDSKAGRATFLPLDTIRPSSFEARDRLNDEGIVGLASELVSCDNRYDAIISSLLGRIVVASDLDAAAVCAKKMGYRYRIVTLDGQVINAGGSYTGGYTAQQGGVFTRKNEIDKLEKQVETLQKGIEKRRADVAALTAEVAGYEAEMLALNADQITANEDRVRASAVQLHLEADIGTIEDNINDSQAELAANATANSERSQRISANEGKINVLTQEIGRLELSAGDESQSGGDFMKRRADMTAALGDYKIERVEKQKDVENIEQAVETLLQQSGLADDRAANIAAAIARVEEQNVERARSIEQIGEDLGQMKAAIAQYRLDIETMIANRTESERETSQNQSAYGDFSRQREDIGREIARLEERKIALQNEFDSAVSRLWEEYELTRPEAEKLRVPFESITELRQQVGALRARIKSLGSVNVGAIEELAEVSERFTFLTEQVTDVEKSREELKKLIAQLESEMTQIFTRNFHEINKHFRRVFVELFGGGSANLALTDETDVLNSGIEMDVQPPGKVIKNLAALSGGEQALVAIALYFSILAVNPSPFCVLDEIDSALDDANVNRFASYLRRVTGNTQIIAITHRRGTMEGADILYGVTMQEEGVSKLLRLSVEEAQLVVSK